LKRITTAWLEQDPSSDPHLNRLMVKGGVPVWYAKVSRRKEESMGTETTDDGRLAATETGTPKLDPKRHQHLWQAKLDLAGLRGEVNAINKEVNRLLKKKKDLTSKLEQTIPPTREPGEVT
jgi:hypothetical protein